MITIGIVSFNRLKYLKALFNSMESLDRKLFEVIVVDNGSWESGLSTYLLEQKEIGNISNLILREKDERNWINDEYIAKNIIIENSSNETIVFLQDDLQFIADQTYLMKLCEDFMTTDFQCMEFNGIRKVTNINKFSSGRYAISNNGLKYWVSDKPHFQTMGIFKKSTFLKCGKYPVDWPLQKEYWGRSEDYYDMLVKKNYRNINISAHFPAFLGVWNDHRGGYSFIRDDLRYAEYIDVVNDNKLYYGQHDYNYIKEKQSILTPLSFMDVAVPLGWKITTTPDGDQVKYNQKIIVSSEPGVQII